MDDYKADATKYTPEIFLDHENNVINIKGASYPGNAQEVYDPVFSWLNEYLEQMKDERLTVNIELYYFNSITSMLLMIFFGHLNDAVKQGKDICINWIYEKDDEDGEEFGQDFQEDFNDIKFNLVEKE